MCNKPIKIDHNKHIAYLIKNGQILKSSLYRQKKTRLLTVTFKTQIPLMITSKPEDYTKEIHINENEYLTVALNNAGYENIPSNVILIKL